MVGLSGVSGGPVWVEVVGLSGWGGSVWCEGMPGAKLLVCLM